MAREKFMNGVYGACPRILCHKQSVLPYGISEEMKYTRVMIFCPSCQEVYKPRGNLTDMDGAYIGPNFPQHFLLYYKDFNYFKKEVPLIQNYMGLIYLENQVLNTMEIMIKLIKF